MAGVLIPHFCKNTWTGSFQVLRSPCGTDSTGVAAGSNTLSLAK